jgi:hypothetical protein
MGDEGKEKKLPGNFKDYEDGKHRRYGLLFSVNGGAFAIVQFVLKEETRLNGGLSLKELAVGMILFTALMVWDIFKFGENMREFDKDKILFGPVGKTVLLSLGALICAGWASVACGDVAAK